MPSKSGVGSMNTEAVKASPNDCSGLADKNDMGATGPTKPEGAMALVALAETAVSPAGGGFVAEAAELVKNFATAVNGLFITSMRNGGGPICGKYGRPACAATPSATKAPSAFSETIPIFTGRFIVHGGKMPLDASSENIAGT